MANDERSKQSGVIDSYYIKDGKITNKETGRMNMSLTGTLQKIEKENEDLTAKLVEAAEKEVEMQGQLDAKDVAHAKEIVVIKAEGVTATEEAVAKAKDEAKVELEAAEKLQKETQAKLDAATAKLANPAIKDADLTGADALPDGGEAGDDKLEKDAYAEYRALDGDPAAQTAYWNANEEAIRAAMAVEFEKAQEEDTEDK